MLELRDYLPYPEARGCTPLTVRVLGLLLPTLHPLCPDRSPGLSRSCLCAQRRGLRPLLLDASSPQLPLMGTQNLVQTQPAWAGTALRGGELQDKKRPSRQ